MTAVHGHVNILHLLVENGADLEAQENYGDSRTRSRGPNNAARVEKGNNIYK